MQLTKHFTLEELIASDTALRQGIDNSPPPHVVDNLQKTALLLEEVRKSLGGRPLYVTSGYRCPELNQRIGSSQSSAHVQGCAADFICPAFGSPHQIARWLHDHMERMGVDQLIKEFAHGNSGWVHIAHAPIPRMMALTIDDRGTQRGIV